MLSSSFLPLARCIPSIGLLVYFIWTGFTGLSGFLWIFILLFCQFPEETNKAKSTCGGKKLQLCLHVT
jgi:hypothetical protein